MSECTPSNMFWHAALLLSLSQPLLFVMARSHAHSR